MPQKVIWGTLKSAYAFVVTKITTSRKLLKTSLKLLISYEQCRYLQGASEFTATVYPFCK